MEVQEWDDELIATYVDIFEKRNQEAQKGSRKQPDPRGEKEMATGGRFGSPAAAKD